jgi:nondiscriminating glutamyl-tRNA synthetase
MTVRTRFAPSPTGRLHLGNIRAAVFNWLLARRQGGQFIVRIEDTDQERNVDGGEEGILHDLGWLGLDWDEGPDVGGPHGPYRQSDRKDRHDQAVDALLAGGQAYPCFCSEAQLALDMVRGEDGREVLRYPGRCRELDEEQRSRRAAEAATPLIRFAVPEELTNIEIHDEVFGSISFPTSDIDDFVIRRSDGRVTYNLGVVVDDIDMEISHVVRGAGHLPNTPKQALLFDAMGRERPRFAHLPTVLGAGGGKLSKRAGAEAVADLASRGYPPAGVLNYVSLLGWSHPEEKEVLSPEELVDAVSLDRVGRSDPRMDPEKLRWVCAQHIAQESLEELTDHVAPFVDSARFPLASERLGPVVDVLRSRLSVYGDINDHLDVLFPEDDGELRRARQSVADDPSQRRVLEALEDALEGLEEWTADTTGDTVRGVGKEIEARGPALFHPIRRSLTGIEKGPDLGKLLAALGRKETLRRIGLTLGKLGV